MRRVYVRLFLTQGLLLFGAICNAPLRAQNAVSTGIVEGRVDDPSGAVVAGAIVTLANTSNGFRQSGLSNNDGRFTFPAVPSGVYSVSTSSPGFKAVTVTNVSASVGQTTTLTVKMEVGDVSEEVNVSAEAEVLNTSDSSISSVVGDDTIQNLPSLRRQYTDFALLSPSVTVDGQFGSISFAGTQGDYTSNYAHGNGGNAFSVDGANATSRYLSEQRMQTIVPYVFGSESIQEFQISENPYSPAYGGGSAGYINTVTKSGTNAFHGYAFYYNRNSATGAIDAVSKANGYPKAQDVRQQFGAGLGGPIVKNKLFFFFDYEQQRRKNPISIINTGQAALNVTSFGLPAGTVLPAPTGYPVPSGLTAAAPGNPVYLQQVSNALYEIQSNLGFYPRRQDDLVFFERADLLATAKDQITMRYNYNTFVSPGGVTSNPVPNFGYTFYPIYRAQDHDALIHSTHVASPTLLLDTHVFFSLNNTLQDPSGIAPVVSFSAPSSFSIGPSAGSDVRETEWGGSEQISWQKGRHTLNFGGDVAYDRNVSLSYSGYFGTYRFGSPTAFALGQYTTYSQSSGTPVYRIGFPTYGLYIGDTYKVNKELTLTLGLREDWQVYPQPPANPVIPLTGQYNNDYNRWSPRVGFAYNVLSRTVIRGGVGVFRPFLSSLNYIAATTSNGLASLRSSTTLSYNSALAPNAQSLVFPNILPSTASLFSASPNVTVIDPGFRDPSTNQASLQIEQQLTDSLTMMVGSIWSHSEHLVSSSYYDLNQKRPTGTTTYVVCPPGTKTLPCAGSSPITLMNLDSGTLQEGALYPGVGQVDALVSPGNSTYISGFAQFRQRYHRGFSATLTYTLSHNIADNGFNFNNQWDFSNTKGPSLLDQRHKVLAAVIYQPQYSGTSRFAKSLLSNWMISTITQYGSGHPYAGILTSACVGSSLATCTSGSNLNDSAFNYGNGIAGGGPSPNIGLNSFYGPWLGAVDGNVERAWNIKEDGKLMFRVTAFNLLNNANYYVYSGSGINQAQYRPVGPSCGDRSQTQTCYLIPNNGVGGFGTFSVVAQNTGPRIFQFAMIYRF
jgi:hypothetical protein